MTDPYIEDRKATLLRRAAESGINGFHLYSLGQGRVFVIMLEEQRMASVDLSSDDANALAAAISRLAGSKS